MKLANVLSLLALIISMLALGFSGYVYFHQRAATETERETRVRCDKSGTRPAVQNFSGSKTVKLAGVFVWTLSDSPELRGQQGQSEPVEDLELAPLERYEPSDEVLFPKGLPRENIVGYAIAFDVISEGLPRPVTVQCKYRLEHTDPGSQRRYFRLVEKDHSVMDLESPERANDFFVPFYFEKTAD